MGKKFVLVLLICYVQYSFAVGNFSSQNLSAVCKRISLFNGFHRILSYNINIHGFTGKTKLLIKENFPKEIYIDPYQIPRRTSNLAIKFSVAILDNLCKMFTYDIKKILVFFEDDHFRKIPQIQFINIETPAYNAQPLYIELYSCSKNASHNVDLPFHVRYMKPQQCNILGETVEIKLRPPSIFVTSNDSPCITDDSEVDSWTALEHEMQPVSFQVPVGCTEHFNTVLYLTVLVIGLSTMYIFHVLFHIKV